MNQTNYEFLLEKQKSGELDRLFDLGLNEKTTKLRMRIYAYHLAYPKASQWDVCLELGVSKKTVWNTYQLMEKTTATYMSSLMSAICCTFAVSNQNHQSALCPVNLN